jgi:hypothetical protein
MRRIILIPILLLAAPHTRASDYSARVVGISDGDTLTVLKDRTQVRIRLHGIDAPETGQDFASRSRPGVNGGRYSGRRARRSRRATLKQGISACGWFLSADGRYVLTSFSVPLRLKCLFVLVRM